jgi:hypothetical protein
MYTLIQQAMEEVQVYQKMAWAVVLEVTSSDEEVFPPKVFCYQSEGAEEGARAWFTTVCSPADLAEYPEDAPAPGSEVQQPFFRKSAVTLVSRNPRDIELLIEQIQTRINMLQANLTAINNLNAP